MILSDNRRFRYRNSYENSKDKSHKDEDIRCGYLNRHDRGHTKLFRR